MNTKICSKCKEEKPLEDFYKDNRKQGMFRSQCKICIDKIEIERRKQYASNTHSKSISKKKCAKCKEEKLSKEFYKIKSTKSGLSAYCISCLKDIASERYKKNKEKIDKKNKEWQESNKEKFIEMKKNWRNQNKEGINQYHKDYHKKNPHKVREKNRKRRAIKASVNESFTATDELLIKSRFDNQCFNCGSTEHLNIDHHYPLSKGFALTINNAVLLCKSCNCSKGPKLPEDFYTSEQINELNNILK